MYKKNRISNLKLVFVLVFSFALIFGWCLKGGRDSEVKGPFAKTVYSKSQQARYSEDEEFYMNQGNYFFEAGEYLEAMKNYNSALELNPLNYDAAYQIGECYDKLDRIQEAIVAHKRAKIIRAKKDCWEIIDALRKFHEDTGTWPFYNDCYVEGSSREATVDFLYGNMGDYPGFPGLVAESWGDRGEDMYNSFIVNGNSCPWYKPKFASVAGNDDKEGWDGPYLPYISEDPWGYKYFISVSGFAAGTNPENMVWCLSAGPNFNLNTPAYSKILLLDDIGYIYQEWD